MSPVSRAGLRTFSSKISVLRVSEVLCANDDDSSESKGSKTTPVEASDNSNENKGKGTGKGRGGGNNSHLSCPKCGDPCTHVETFVCKY